MTGYARGEADFAAAAADRFRRDARPASIAPKDYSVPLHVDCSIEYELPDCAKPPQGVKIEPLLMIHPSHFRRLESLRRVPFVNNLPRGETAATAAVTPGRARAARGGRRCCRAAPAPAAPPPQPQPAQHARARAAAPVPELSCYRFESYESAGAGGGKAARARLKAHPYLGVGGEPLPLPLPLDCDIARALPPPAPHYDRFDKRALQQLPIYM